MQQGQALIIGHICADTGIQTHGADIQRNIAVAIDQVEGIFLGIQQPLQIKKCLGIVKQLHKVIAAAAGKHGDGHIVKARCALHHFVQGAIAATGINAVLLAAFSSGTGDFPASAGGIGNPDLIV